MAKIFSVRTRDSGSLLPPAPSGLAIVLLAATQIQLSWNAIGGAAYYRVFRNGIPIGGQVFSSNFSDGTVTPSTFYSYQVSCVNAYGEGPKCTPVSGTTPALLPSQPTGLVATALSSSSIGLTWNSAANATTYNLRRGGNVISTGIVGLNATDGGLNPSTLYSYTVTGQNTSGEGSQSASASATTQASSPTAMFPRFALSCSDGQQLPRTDAHIKALAAYPMLILDGEFNGAINAPFSRDYIVTHLKSYVGVDSFHPAAPLVIQYEITNYNNPNTPEWTAVTNTNNWWVRNAWPAGAINGAPSNQQINYIPYNTDGATGLTAGQWDAQYMTDRYMKDRVGSLATSTSFASFGSTSLDGIIKDNQSYPQLDGDWRHLGSSQSSSDQTVFDLFWTGIVQYATKFRALNPGKLCIGNTSWAYSQYNKSPKFTGSSPVGVFDYPMEQFVCGRNPLGVFTIGGWITGANNNNAWAWYTTMTNSAANGACLITAAFATTEFALMGSSMCMTLMKDGYLQPGLIVGSDPNQDYVDGDKPANWPVCDEMFGGTLRNPAFLGHNLGTAQGQQQTAPWQNGVYRRDFDNGIVLWNPSGAPQTVTLEAGFWHLKSLYGSQAINDGSAVGPGNYTIPGGVYTNSANDRCGIVLVRSQPPAN